MRYWHELEIEDFSVCQRVRVSHHHVWVALVHTPLVWSISSLPSGLSLKSSLSPLLRLTHTRASSSPEIPSHLGTWPLPDEINSFLNQGKLMSPSSERVTPGLRSPTLPTSPRSLGLLPSVPTSTCPSPSLLNRCKILWLKCFQLTEITTGVLGVGMGEEHCYSFSHLSSCLPLKIHMFWAYVGTNTQTYWLWKRHIFCTPWHLLVLVKHIALLFMIQHGQKTHSNVSSLYVSPLITDINHCQHNLASPWPLRDSTKVHGEWLVGWAHRLLDWWVADRWCHPFSYSSPAISLFCSFFLFLKRNQISFPVKTEVH